MALSPTDAARVRDLLERLNAVEDLLAGEPAQRQLKFALIGSGKGYIRGDEARVRLCCDLYNDRELLKRLLQGTLDPESGR